MTGLRDSQVRSLLANVSGLRFPSPAMPAQDTKLVIRCPYCILGLDFRPMAAHKDGRFVCEKCGHAVHPEEAAYLCSCCRCLRLKDAAAWLEERWLQ
jgi:ribosomal protein S27AE